MRNLLITLLLVCASFSASAGNSLEDDSGKPATLELRASLIGTWHNKITQSDGGYREEFLSITKDGTFRLRFLSVNRVGRMVDAYAIVGIWGVAEDIFFTSNLNYEYLNDVAYPAYLGDAHEFNAYRILEINDKMQRYQPLGKSQSATLKRLAVDPCKVSSGVKTACANQDRILEPSGSNNGSAISLAE